MELIRDFADLGKNDASIAGGKGASLGEMTQAGLPVPPGFVILAGSFDKFCEQTDLNVEIDSILGNVNHQEVHTIENASEQIGALIMAAQMPEDIGRAITESFNVLDATYVAVRSSATAEDSSAAAWAGQLDSFLNTTEGSLLENVKRCWASLFTPRAIFYRFEKDLHKTQISVAVVVQKMVESEKSGIAFSVHPVTEDQNQLIIEAGYGLGEAIVSGQITPDSYVVEKEPRKIIDINVAEQERGLYRRNSPPSPEATDESGNEWQELGERGKEQVLSEQDILNLSEIILNIEKHYGFPCDIEWAYERGKFYIVQSRPITTLANTEKKVSKSEINFDGRDWFLAVTRNMSFWHQYLSNEGNFHCFKEFEINSRLQSVTITADAVRTSIFFLQSGYGECIKAVMESVSSETAIKNLKKKYETFALELLASLEKVKENLSEENLKEFNNQYRRFTPGLNITLIVGRAGGEQLAEKLRVNGVSEDEIPETIASITYPQKHTPLFNSQLDLFLIGVAVQKNKLSGVALRIELEKWLNSYGHIPVNFCEEPWTFKDVENRLAELLKKNCKKEYAEAERSHNEKIKKAKSDLKRINNSEITVLALAVAEATYLNEFRKNVFSRVSLGYRPVFEKIAKLAGSANWRDCFFLIPDEMIALVRGESVDLEAIKSARRVVGMHVDKNGQINILDDKTTKIFYDHVCVNQGAVKAGAESSEKIIRGFSANKGKITGVAKLILTTKDFNKLNTGDILVATMTSVDFVPVMERAAAFVTNEGGITCHASIVAREMNKPCIIGTKIATQVLKDGDLVEVDADKGVVRILESFRDVKPTKNKLVKLVERANPPLFLNFICNGLTNKRTFEVLGYELGNDRFYLYMDNIAYIDEESQNDIDSRLFEIIDNDGRIILRKFYQIWMDLCSELLEKCNSLKDFSLRSNADIAKIFDSIKETCYSLSTSLNLPLSIEKYLEKRVDEIISGNNISLDVVELTKPKLKNENEEEAESLNNIVGAVKEGDSSWQDDPEVDLKISEHILKYGWMNVGRFFHDAWSIEDVKNRIMEKLDTDTGKEIAGLKKENSWPALNNQENEIIDISKDYVFLRTYRMNCFMKAAFLMRPLLQDIAKRLKIEFNDLIYMTPEEIINCLTSDVPVPEKLIGERKMDYGYTIEGGVIAVRSGEKWSEIKKNYSDDTRSGEVKTISGKPAFGGSARGAVKLVKITEHLSKVNRGDILVAPMTVPSFIPAMERAAAFITDEGGMLCHAAIIAREMKKPCIIGTKIATQVLKDGDLVEVDADKGIVKLLKASQKKDIMLSKYNIRERPFYDFRLWQEANSEKLKEVTGIGVENLVFIRESDSNRTTAWYDLAEMRDKTGYVVNRIMTEKDYFKKIVASFKENWLKIKPYLRDGKKIESIDELKKYSNDLVAFWAESIVFLVIPRVEMVPEYIRSEAAVLRDSIQDVSDKRSLLAVDFIDSYYPEYSSISELMLPEEVFLLKDRKLTDKEIAHIESRRRGAVLLNGREIPVENLEAELKKNGLRLEHDAVDSNITELRGQVGFTGMATGKAKIVLIKKEFDKFEEGDILISSMTTPHFVPLMKKAAAIITDEGGITCHAAIIARELKKPCVIGAKIATQVLKDGDMVEVDADNGVVRIIK